MENNEIKICNCHTVSTQKEEDATKKNAVAKKTVRSIGSVALSILIAFFPKCPVCLAAYMSMFGSFSLANSPFLGLLFPLFISFLVLHLLMMLKKSKQKGYGPFLLSLAGALFILSGRILFNYDKTILVTGMLLILSGSLWNSFSPKKNHSTIAN